MGEFVKIGRVTSDSVKKHTKRGWAEWIPLLNKAGAKSWTHQEIVAFLKKKYKLTHWWQQSVTLGYEIAIGRRQEGTTLKGDYTLTVTKSFHVSANALWKLLNSQEGIRIWLNPMSRFQIKKAQQFETEAGFFGEVRTLVPGQRVRMTWRETEWPKASVVQIFIVSRPKNKCLLVFSHENLNSGRIKMQMREHWRAAVEQLHSMTKN